MLYDIIFNITINFDKFERINDEQIYFEYQISKDS